MVRLSFNKRRCNLCYIAAFSTPPFLVTAILYISRENLIESSLSYPETGVRAPGPTGDPLINEGREVFWIAFWIFPFTRLGSMISIAFF